MATTLTPTSSSPYALKYLFVTDAVGGDAAVRTQTQMIADLPGGGPLRELLVSITSDGVWTSFEKTSPMLSIYSTPSDQQAINDVAVAFQVLVPDRIMIVASNEPASAIIEVRFHHTIAR